MRKIFLVLVFCSSIFSSFSQNALSARQIVDTLCSPYFWGRGYTNNGLEKAAQYLAQSFSDIGVQPLKPSGFFQEFLVPTNTFPDRMQVLINGKHLRAGIDFLVAPESKGISIYDIHLLPKDSISFVNTQHNIEVKLVDKLVWRPSQELMPYTRIEILKSLNLKPISIDINIDQEFFPNFPTVNVCGFVPGTLYPDSFFVITAHYDHLGGMGAETYFPGANDNASGVAFLLQLAQYYSQNPLPYSVGFILFSAEELGLLGSQYFTSHPLIPLDRIKFLLNTDLAGTGDEGITVVNAPAHPQAFELMQTINKKEKLLNAIHSRTNAPNSDHYYFTLNNVPAFFFYTHGGVAFYHDVYDQAATLPLNHQDALMTLIKQFFWSMSYPEKH